MRPTPLRAGIAATAATAASLALAVPAVAAPSTDALIAEVYGGGGNSGATLTQDFVELANRGSAPVAVDGWSVQYLPASASAASQWQVTPLSGAIASGGRFLVAQAKGSGGTVELPAPDATGSIAMAGSGGTVALVTATTPLTCKTAADCAADERVRDLVGYGSATVVREGTATGNLSSTTSAARPQLADTDDNAADFTVGAPTPVNAKGEGAGGQEPDPEPDPEPGDKRIRDIQGTTRVSPLLGQKVTGVPGVVTATRATGDRGFWFQDTAPDTDPRTSEGLFVYTAGLAPTVQPGDSVLVSGTVAEYRPGGTAASNSNQTLTELTSATVTVLSSGNPLPEPEIIALPDGYLPAAGSGGDIEGLPLDPATYALDWLESREGMAVRADDLRVVGPTNGYGETFVTTKPAQNPTPRGGTVYLGYDQPNNGRIKVKPGSATPPKSNVGDVWRGATVGNIEYTDFGGYTLAAKSVGEHVPGGIAPEKTDATRQFELSVATYNVENLSPADQQAKFDRLASAVVTNLAGPDVVVLEEIQDNNGATDDGTVAADQTYARFTAAITAAGGPRYQWRQIDPRNKADGGEPGGNIRVAFLFNPARVSFVDRPGGDATTPVSVVKRGGRAALSVSPGRVDPANPAWENSRKPLAGEFTFRGRTVFVVANHFNSKGGDQAMHGRYQAPVRGSEVQRGQQAAALKAFVDQVKSVDRGANVVLAGDINDYQFSPALGTLTSGGAIVDLISTLPPNERYSYVHEGNSQTLDHILISSNMTRYRYDVVHINAEFADQASDHDPQVVKVRPSTGNPHLDKTVFAMEDLLECLRGLRP
ncbi:putative extracellular nuclease [Saccharothrix coeruleofusca]|uniref:endonuclease/exonuclease/phosphatase family protein n=1 Tax=Saccharothrix coeruleofusca TaxID=33919 RepID=UPI001AE6B94D|nr:endonuclease/exonuclease/phosphatase family protein [Saccharothrix coeruleofusca]MBP2340217.1 putative extracellular nuclease [Saccharothrix coeruleofusca]